MKRLASPSGSRMASPIARRSWRALTLAVLTALPAMAAAADPAPAPSAKQDMANSADQVRVQADRIDGRDDIELNARDSVRVERGAAVLTGDLVHYDLITSNVSAQGNVLLQRGEDHISGPRARLNLDTWFGEIDTPNYSFMRMRKVKSTVADSLLPGSVLSGALAGRMVTGSGHADSIELEGENKYHLINSTYSSCKAPSPDWYLRVGDLRLDYDHEQGEGHDTTIVFQNVPILYTPWLSFPLSGGRQSGFLPPTQGGSSSTGIEVTVPYYFNLAPNYDLTLAPRQMTRRGLQIGAEGRYLMPEYHGIVRSEYLADDAVTNTSRSLLMVNHQQDFGHGLSGFVDVNVVSDKTYFADLSSKITSTSQANLNQQAVLNYNNGAWLSSTLQVQRYQTLTGDSPYDRLPQLDVTLRQPDWRGLSLVMPMEYTQFSHPTKDKGQRSVLYPQVAYPLTSSAFYFTPKVGVSMASYAVDRRSTVGPDNLKRAVPVTTLDSGVSFERELQISGRDMIQTVEPRLYYVRAAYHNQDDFPVFDTAAADFNYAQIFSENIYSGQDRIVDANQLTAGVQSRFIATDSGEQLLGATLGQRYYFRNQRVTLPGETPRSGRVADILAGVTGKIYRNVWLDSALQYDPRRDQMQQASLGLRYQPAYAKVLSFSYRYKNQDFRTGDVTQQWIDNNCPADTRCGYRDIDVTGQWPLWGRWYGVGRYNRNLRDHLTSEALAGIEYKADCWVFRGAWHSLLNTSKTRNNSYFLQIEFNDFTYIGVGGNAVGLLRRNVSGYGKINEEPSGGSIFSEEP